MYQTFVTAIAQTSKLAKKHNLKAIITVFCERELSRSGDVWMNVLDAIDLLSLIVFE